MWVSHCVNETPWDKTHPAQAFSIQAQKCLTKKISTDRLMLHTRKVQNCVPPWINHGFSARLAKTYTAFSILTRQQNISHQKFATFHKKIQGTNKSKTSSFGEPRSSCTELGTMEEIIWHCVWETTAEIEWTYSELWLDRPSSNLMEIFVSFANELALASSLADRLSFICNRLHITCSIASPGFANCGWGWLGTVTGCGGNAGGWSPGGWSGGGSFIPSSSCSPESSISSCGLSVPSCQGGP